MRRKYPHYSLVAVTALLVLWPCPAALAQQAEAAEEAATEAAAVSADTEMADAAMVDAETVRELLTVTGAVEVLDQMWDGMISQLQMAYPDLSQSVWDELAATYGMESLVDEIVPIYQRYLTQDDAEAAVAFWQSDAGRRFAGVQAAMATEGTQAGMAWGQRVDEFLSSKVEEMEAAEDGEVDEEGEGTEEEMNEGGGR